MTERRRRNVWLRMTDQAGLTEPGKKPQPISPKALLFGAIVWSVSAVLWLSVAFRTEGQIQFLHGVLVAISLTLAAGYVVMLFRSNKR
ncbi:MAG TPA: hypothetical protein VF885_25495 [Arthrobacter sp.]